MHIEVIGKPAESNSVTVAVMDNEGNIATSSDWETESGPQSAVLRLIALAASNVGIVRVSAVVYYHNA